MTDVTLFHNPRCSKSREALRLLEARGLKPKIVEYLVTPPDAATLRELMGKLGLRPKDVLRRGEALADELEDDEAVIRAIASAPILLERPIAVVGERARIGRPPERVLEILE